MEPADAIARLARSQHAFVTHRQLLGVGLSADEIRGRRRQGLLGDHHRGVYLVGPMPPTRRGRCKAATLALEGAAVSHDHACELHGLIRQAGGPIHLTRTTGANSTRHRGLVLHRFGGLPEDWSGRVESIPVVAPMLAIIQSAGSRGPTGIRRLLDQAETRRLLNVAAFDRFLDGLPQARHHGFLRAAIEPFRKELHEADVGLGTRFLRWCHERRLILPATNVPIGRFEVDFHWAGTPLVVETDGFAPHRSRSAFDRDRERWSALAAMGYTVIVVTDRRLSGHADALYREIVTVLRRAGVM